MLVTSFAVSTKLYPLSIVRILKTRNHLIETAYPVSRLVTQQIQQT